TELPKSEQPKQIASTKTSPVAQATYQEPGESKLAWSDEADQTRLVEQEIQREQQKAQQSILSKAPASNPKSRIAQAPPQKARPKAQPKSDPWQLIHQRQVGPQETDSNRSMRSSNSLASPRIRGVSPLSIHIFAESRRGE
ncbi:MAG: hypothetical protein ACKOAH_28605, partial [Pirellula sp.]